MAIWKNCFLPKEKSAEGSEEDSSCEIFMPKTYEVNSIKKIRGYLFL